MKKLIDIEKLLQWAMQDELPKGQAVAASAWDVLTQFAALGVRVQTSGFQGDGFGFTPGAPHEDALIVAAAMKSLNTVARFDSVDQVLPLFGDLTPIAGDAVSSIMRAEFDPRSIVISCATIGKRPEWNFEHPTPYQMFAPTFGGRPRALVFGIDADGDLVEMRARRKDGKFNLSMSPRSPLNWNAPSMVEVGEGRAEYVAWHGALVSLAASLSGKLAEFEPVAPAAARLPWITGETEVSRVITGRDLSSAFGEKLALAPKRKVALEPVESPIEAESVASYARASRTKMRKVAAV
ncbi:MAG: hypothetical protein OJF48_003418 [Afipia sp.]|jgi:hypothetical protein|nr:MAG: hypothetical protein OJF48_003418 [Afipia sp.]